MTGCTFKSGLTSNLISTEVHNFEFIGIIIGDRNNKTTKRQPGCMLDTNIMLNGSL
jgi:hypothetical protein